MVKRFSPLISIFVVVVVVVFADTRLLVALPFHSICEKRDRTCTYRIAGYFGGH